MILLVKMVIFYFIYVGLCLLIYIYMSSVFVVNKVSIPWLGGYHHTDTRANIGSCWHNKYMFVFFIKMIRLMLFLCISIENMFDWKERRKKRRIRCLCNTFQHYNTNIFPTYDRDIYPYFVFWVLVLYFYLSFYGGSREYYTIQFYTILVYTIYYTILYYIILYYTGLYYPIL